MAEKKNNNPVPSIKDRLVIIGNDQLLPYELTVKEMKFIFDSVNTLIPLDKDSFKLFRQPLYDDLNVLENQSPNGLISIASLAPEDWLFSLDDSVDIFDHQQQVYVSLSLPVDFRKEKQLKYWKKRFEKQMGRKPTDEEQNIHLKPGYQLQVLGHDDNLRGQLTDILTQRGFYVSPYRGLEDLDDSKIKDKDKANAHLFRVGRKGGKFNKSFNVLLKQLEDKAELIKLVMDEQIPKDLASEIIESELTRRKVAYEFLLFQIQTSIEDQHPKISLEEINITLTKIKFDLFMGKI